MANELLGGELFSVETPKKTDTQGKTSSAQEVTKKEGESLFDKLLKQATTVEKSVEKVTPKTSNDQKMQGEETQPKSPQKQENTEIKNDQSLDSKNIPTKENVVKKETQTPLIQPSKITTTPKEEPSKPLSMFDAMIQNAKVTPKTDTKPQENLSQPKEEASKVIQKTGVIEPNGESKTQKEGSYEKGSEPQVTKEKNITTESKQSNPKTTLLADLTKQESSEIKKENTKLSIKEEVVIKEVLSKDEVSKIPAKKEPNTQVITSQKTNEEILSVKLVEISQEESSGSSEVQNTPKISLLDSMVASIKEEIGDKEQGVKTNQVSQNKIATDGLIVKKREPQGESKKESTIIGVLGESINGTIKKQKEIQSQKLVAEVVDTKAPLGAAAFLSNQKVQGEILSQHKLQEAKETLKEGAKNTKTIEKAASIIGLNPHEVTLEEESQTPLQKDLAYQAKKIQTQETLTQQQAQLNRIFLHTNDQTHKHQTGDLQGIMGEQKISEASQAHATKEENRASAEITMSVDKVTQEAFVAKVVTAKQTMGTFMSDLARTMYLNYKPPVTALKINLDPGNLGSIAIVMRSNRSENTLSVSLSISQNSTLDSFNDNKAALQNALGKVFGTSETAVSLQFGMQNDSSNQAFEQFNEGQKEQNRGEGRSNQSTNRGVLINEEGGETTENQHAPLYM